MAPVSIFQPATAFSGTESRMTQKKSGEATLEKGRRFVQAAGLIFYILAAQGTLEKVIDAYIQGNRA